MEGFTEQDVAEELGVQIEEHDDDGAALEEHPEPAGAGEGHENNDQDGQEPPEDHGETGGQEGAEGRQNGGEGRREPQKPEERRQWAERRRAWEAEDRARRAAQESAVQARVDQAYADMFRGQVNPFTKQPITTQKEFQAYQAERQRRDREQELKSAGIAPETIRGMVEQEMAPFRQQMEAARMAAAQARAREVRAAAQKSIEASLKNISALDPSIKSMEDIAAMPTAERFNELVQKGIGMEDAFYLANRKEIEGRKVAAATAAARTNAASRSHLNPVKPGSGKPPVEVPAAQAEMYREMMPDATDEEIRTAYARYLKDLGM